MPIRLGEKTLYFTAFRKWASPNLVKPHHAGGGGGKECAARHEPTLRGVDSATTGPRGAAGPHNPEADLARGAGLAGPYSVLDGKIVGQLVWPITCPTSPPSTASSKVPSTRTSTPRPTSCPASSMTSN